MKSNEIHSKISVIIPCYNAEELIRETLRSLEMQTFRDFEVICINDGSIDNTIEIINEFTNQSNLKIKCFSQKNGGVSRARNRGIKEAKSDYITFLDADDVYHPYFLEALYKQMRTDIDTVYCKLTRNLETLNFNKLSNSLVLVSSEENRDQFMKKALYKMGIYGFYCYLYKKSIIDEFNIVFPVDIKYGEDREFIWKYLTHCKKAAYVDETLYGYRDNPMSVVNTTNWRRTDALTSVINTEKYLKVNRCEFYAEFKQYMYARNMWAVAKNFTQGNRKDLFLLLIKEYDVGSPMKYLNKNRNKLVALSSILYRIHPMLFFRTIRIYYFIKNLVTL
ncbi:MAG TPA: glycosyltransferase family 2 protein [Gallicola sp.]|nr:glycosyltransferase family 2 protein [Gallicola sp.]